MGSTSCARSHPAKAFLHFAFVLAVLIVLAQVAFVKVDAAQLVVPDTQVEEVPEAIINEIPLGFAETAESINEKDKANEIFQSTIKLLESLARSRKPRSPAPPKGDIVASLLRVLRRALPTTPRGDEPVAAEWDLSLEEEEDATSNVGPWLHRIPKIETDDSAVVKRAKALKTLKILGYQAQSSDALLALGDIYLYANYMHPRNASTAFKHYVALAHDLGNAVGQRMVGLMYATGLGVPRNYPRALTYMSFATVGKDTVAEQTLGYWHLMGIGTPKNCEDAAWYYERVDEKAIDFYKAGPPGGLPVPQGKVRLPEEEGGVFGHGASGAGDPTIRTGGSQAGALTAEDIFQFYKLQADGGDAVAQLVVGQLYYQGTNAIKQDFQRALQMFLAAAKQYPPETEAQGVDAAEEKKIASAAAQAAGFLGQMYWRGEAIAKPDERTAKYWFEVGARRDNAASMNGLGMMHLRGAAGLPKDKELARRYFEKAAAGEHSDGLANYGEMLLENKAKWGDAIRMFNRASTRGHILATYRMGQMYTHGMGIGQNCHVGVSYLKTVAEKADWHDSVVRDAHRAYKDGDMEGAFVRYLLAAERGYEIAQTNAAWLIDKGIYDPSKSNLFGADHDAYETALSLWNRAANQANVDARVKMGDYYYYGLGGGAKDDATAQSATGAVHDQHLGGGFGQLLESILPHRPPRRRKPDPAKAALYYQVAAESEFSSLAMWNLGWMHESGIGVEKDFHLAKRLYDLSLSTNPEAYLPVNLALAKLYVKWAWAYVTGQMSSPPALFSNSAAKPVTVAPAPPPPPPEPAGGDAGNVPMDDEEQLTAWLRERRREDAGGFDNDDDDWYDDEGDLENGEMALIVMLCGIAVLLLGMRQRVGRAAAAAPVPAGNFGVGGGARPGVPPPALQQQQERRDLGGLAMGGGAGVDVVAPGGLPPGQNRDSGGTDSFGSGRGSESGELRRRPAQTGEGNREETEGDDL
ncbi:ERAD-associated protein [Borealophlyctis nickersoniae]|nr:ERAD-associated protein [Borealophlyctis nickersoniae]